MNRLIQDLRYGSRQLCKSAGFNTHNKVPFKDSSKGPTTYPLTSRGLTE